MALKTKELHEYLQIVLDMETNLFSQQRLSEELHERLDGIRMLASPEKPSAPQAPKPTKKDNWVLPMILGIGGILLVRFLRKDAHFHGFVAVLFSVLLGALPVSCIIAGICLLFSNVSAKSKQNTAAQKYEQEKGRYPDKLEAYQSKVQATNAENAKRQAERAILQANIDAVERQSVSSRATLDRLYSANIVHPKYRNLSAVSSLYEYIDTGRCAQLEGSAGAYNLFENEVRLDHILLKLDDVIEKLDSIRQGQYQLYTAITEGSQRTESLLESVAQEVKYVSASGQETAKRLTDMAASEEIIAYNTERTQKELEYFNRMRYRLGDYNKVWDNYRP